MIISKSRGAFLWFKISIKWKVKDMLLTNKLALVFSSRRNTVLGNEMRARRNIAREFRNWCTLRKQVTRDSLIDDFARSAIIVSALIAWSLTIHPKMLSVCLKLYSDSRTWCFWIPYVSGFKYSSIAIMTALKLIIKALLMIYSRHFLDFFLIISYWMSFSISLILASGS